jgi:signal transduction histidine kinase
MEELHFKTNIQLKSIIGKDLINDDNIAVLELVKNSFDADAKRVDITFLNLKNNDDATIDTFSDKTSRIIIKDNGVGMNLTDIKDKWLNIAYSEKKSNNRQHNRMMAGAKGVGRFSCDRLGEYLNLYAKKENTDTYILLKIDWKRFEIEDDKKEIQSIILDYSELLKEDIEKKDIAPFDKGVVLEIIKLRSNWVYGIKNDKGEIIAWNTDKLVNLKKYLEKLINPNQAFERNDFGIYLNAPEFTIENEQKENHSKFIGKVENTIFEKLDFKTTSIESEIIENGTVILTTLKDKGQTIFWIKEKNDFLPYLANVKVIIYFLNQYAKAFFTKQTGIRPLEYGSIYLFLNGFRIPPYGQEGDDWLKLEQRRAQGYARFLSQRELVGRIEILDYDNHFKVITSREGLEKNESYNKLIQGTDSFFYKVFRRLERYVVDGLNWDSALDEDRNNWSEVEKKIIAGNIDENNLEYKEDDITKKRRIYQSIHSIIGAKGSNVIELYIDENLILEKIQEEKINAEREFEQLIVDFENKKIDGETLNRILQRKSLENKDLEKQIADFSKYSINEATSKAIAELQHYKDTIEKQTKIIEDLQLRLEKEREEKEQIQQKITQLQQTTKDAEEKAIFEAEKRIEAEKETEKAKKEVQLEKLKVEFYKKQSTPETDALIHHVRNTNLSIKTHIANIFDSITKSNIEQNTKDSIIKEIHEVLHLADKALKATNLILKSDLNESDAQKINLPSFISGYFSNNKFSSKVHIKNSVENFIIIGSKLDLALILDNFIDNSEKWGAENIWITIKLEGGQCVVNVCDDGFGLSGKFKEHPNDIFNFRQTAKVGGTGFGLYLVRESLQKMQAEILIDTPQNNKGMNFKIIFK